MGIGRKEERFYDRDCCPLENVKELDLITERLRAALLTAGYRERIYDQWASAYYKEDCAVREEPIVLHTWRNRTYKPGYEGQVIEVKGEDKRREESGRVFVKFDDETRARMEEMTQPGKRRALSIVVRYQGEASELIKAALNRFFGEKSELSAYQDNQQEPGVETRNYSFGFDLPEPGLAIEDESGSGAAAA